MRIQIRSGTTVQWNTGCVKLACGEMGYDSDTKELKVGNGTDCWAGLTAITGGGGGTGGDPNLMRNIGINAYISNADLTATYNGINNEVTYAGTLYGNSSYYDLTFAYSSSGLSPLTSNTYYVTNNNTIYNNFSALVNPQPPGPNPNYSFNKAFTLSNSSPAPGTYNVTLTISTANAGGVGVGSSYQTTFPLVITASDSMDPPILTFPVVSTIAQGTSVVISGITYYGKGTTVVFNRGALVLNNIYNVISKPTFNYLTITDSTSSTSVTDSVTNLQYGISSPFPATSGLNVPYFNATILTFTLNGNNISGSSATGGSILSYALLNSVNKTRSGRLYPLSQTIGYIDSSNWSISKERDIPLSQAGYTTIAGVTAQTRMSIPGGESTPLTPTIGNILPFNNALLTTRDPAYNPYNGKFYASDFTIALNSTYILPSIPPFTAGTKYLLIQLTNTAALKSFTLRLGSTATDVTNVRVFWRDNVNSQNYGWYDAKIDWQLSGGCQNGFSGNSYTYQIKTNVGATDYYDTSAGGGYIYLNIEFTGSIDLNQIVVT